MKATDKILKGGSFHILSKERSGLTWSPQYILVIQDEMLFFDEDQSWFDTEIGRIPLQNLQAVPLDTKETKFQEVIRGLPEEYLNIIRLCDITTKSVKLIASSNPKDAQELILSINLGSYYAFYYITCKFNNLDTFPAVLDWVIKFRETKEEYFVFTEDFFNEQHYFTIIEFVKRCRFIILLGFNGCIIDPDRASNILQILTNFHPFQLQGIKFINNGLVDAQLDKVSFGITHSQYLRYLEISSNNISDEGLLTLYHILKSKPSLETLNLSNNVIRGAKNFDKFLEGVFVFTRVKKLDLSRNWLEDKSIRTFIAYIFQVKHTYLKELDIANNDFTKQGLYKVFKAYHTSISKTNGLNCIIKPIPFHPAFLVDLLPANQDDYTATLERASLDGQNRRPAARHSEFQSIYEIIDQINRIHNNDTTVEDIAALCERIYKLPFEFPPQKLDLLNFIIVRKIKKSLIVNDYYCLNVLITCAEKLGLDIDQFRNSVDRVKNRIRTLVTDLTKILNFEADEQTINITLDEKLNEAIQLGLRGHLIDTLLVLKDKRDGIIRGYVKDNITIEDIDNQDEDDHPFAVLESDIEFAKPNAPEMNALRTRIDPNLMLHPLFAHYEPLSKTPEQKVKDYLNLITEELKKNDNYYVRLANRKAQFLLCDTPTNKSWKFSKGDKKLHSCRLIFRYWNYLHKDIPKKPFTEIFTPKERKIETPKNLEALRGEYRMNSFKYLRGINDYVSRVRAIRDKKYKDQLQAWQQKQEEELEQQRKQQEEQEKNQNQDRGAILGGVINVFGTIGSVTEKITSQVANIVVRGVGGGTEKDKKDMPQPPAPFRTKNTLDPQQEYVGVTLLEIQSAELMNTAHELLGKLYKYPFDCAQEETPNALIWSLTQLLIPKGYNEEHEELYDEFYLQCYKLCNREYFETSKSVYTAIVVSHFVPPSTALTEYVKVWLYTLEKHADLKPKVELILKNILNHQDPEFVRPYWTPSKPEIGWLLQGSEKIEIEVRYGWTEPEMYQLNYNATVENLMEQIYDSEALANMPDVYAFWVYHHSHGTNSFDEALPRERMLVELMGHWPDNGPGHGHFQVKRRVLSSVFTLNLESLEGDIFESFYSDTLHLYFEKKVFVDYIKIETVTKIAGLLYILRQKQKKIEEIKVTTEKIAKSLSDCIPNFFLITKDAADWAARVANFLNTHIRYHDCTTSELKHEILQQLEGSALFASSHFDFRKKDNLALKNIPIEGLVAVNVFGVYFFTAANKDRPYFMLNYEEITYVIGYGNECKLAFEDKQIKQEIIVTLETPRAYEFSTDILAYAQMRMLEKDRVLYSLPLARVITTVTSRRNLREEFPEELFRGAELEIKEYNIPVTTEEGCSFIFDDPAPFLEKREKPKEPDPKRKKVKRKSISLPTETYETQITEEGLDGYNDRRESGTSANLLRVQKGNPTGSRPSMMAGLLPSKREDGKKGSAFFGMFDFGGGKNPQASAQPTLGKSSSQLSAGGGTTNTMPRGSALQGDQSGSAGNSAMNSAMNSARSMVLDGTSPEASTPLKLDQKNSFTSSSDPKMKAPNIVLKIPQKVEEEDEDREEHKSTLRASDMNKTSPKLLQQSLMGKNAAEANKPAYTKSASDQVAGSKPGEPQSSIYNPPNDRDANTNKEMLMVQSDIKKPDAKGTTYLNKPDAFIEAEQSIDLSTSAVKRNIANKSDLYMFNSVYNSNTTNERMKNLLSVQQTNENPGNKPLVERLHNVAPTFYNEANETKQPEKTVVPLAGEFLKALKEHEEETGYVWKSKLEDIGEENEKPDRKLYKNKTGAWKAPIENKPEVVVQPDTSKDQKPQNGQLVAGSSQQAEKSDQNTGADNKTKPAEPVVKREEESVKPKLVVIEAQETKPELKEEKAAVNTNAQNTMKSPTNTLGIPKAQTHSQGILPPQNNTSVGQQASEVSKTQERRDSIASNASIEGYKSNPKDEGEVKPENQRKSVLRYKRPSISIQKGADGQIIAVNKQSESRKNSISIPGSIMSQASSMQSIPENEADKNKTKLPVPTPKKSQNSLPGSRKSIQLPKEEVNARNLKKALGKALLSKPPAPKTKKAAKEDDDFFQLEEADPIARSSTLSKKDPNAPRKSIVAEIADKVQLEQQLHPNPTPQRRESKRFSVINTEPEKKPEQPQEVKVKKLHAANLSKSLANALKSRPNAPKQKKPVKEDDDFFQLEEADPIARRSTLSKRDPNAPRKSIVQEIQEKLAADFPKDSKPSTPKAQPKEEQKETKTPEIQEKTRSRNSSTTQRSRTNSVRFELPNDKEKKSPEEKKSTEEKKPIEEKPTEEKKPEPVAEQKQKQKQAEEKPAEPTPASNTQMQKEMNVKKLNQSLGKALLSLPKAAKKVTKARSEENAFYDLE